MVLVSFKNIHIWPSYGKKGVHAHIWAYVLWPLLGHFWPIGLKFFMGTKKAIIYRLVMRNRSYDGYLSFLIFGPLLAGKLSGVSKPGQKVGPLGGPFRPTIISKPFLQICNSILLTNRL